MGSKRRGQSLVDISAQLSAAMTSLRFADPVAYTYNPLDYAWELHSQFLRRFGRGRKEVLFLGMNPGPWGMAQTGVPFGEVAAVRDWMKLDAPVGKPAIEHPKRRVEGLGCTRSEVSGARLWGWAQNRFGSAQDFFARRFVTNYCPLVFMEESAKNRTPDKLHPSERQAIAECCDEALRQTVELLRPRIVVGVGVYAESKAKAVLEDLDVEIGRVLHPSPASPVANRGWAAQADKELRALGVI